MCGGDFSFRGVLLGAILIVATTVINFKVKELQHRWVRDGADICRRSEQGQFNRDQRVNLALRDTNNASRFSARHVLEDWEATPSIRCEYGNSHVILIGKYTALEVATSATLEGFSTLLGGVMDSQDIALETPAKDVFVAPSIHQESLLTGKSYTHHTPTPHAVAKGPSVECVLGVDEAGRGPVLGETPSEFI